MRGVESADHGLPADLTIAKADLVLTWLERAPGLTIMYAMGAIVFTIFSSLSRSSPRRCQDKFEMRAGISSKPNLPNLMFSNLTNLSLPNLTLPRIPFPSPSSKF